MTTMMMTMSPKLQDCRDNDGRILPATSFSNDGLAMTLTVRDLPSLQSCLRND